MQSRKKRTAPTASSSRALGGPRYRVIAEAKALAEYYATQPGLEKKEREEKRARWEAVVESAERRGEELRQGKGGGWMGSGSRRRRRWRRRCGML